MTKGSVYILGIESSCDDTGVAIVKNGNHVLANLVSSQIDIHRPYGGVVPEIASRAHIQALQPLVGECLLQSKLSLDDIDALAVTYGPGLAGCLLVGVSFAKSLAYATGKPLLAINHLEAHIYTTMLDTVSENQPPFPHLSLLVSGGHSTLYRVDNWNQLSLIGNTKDDAAGEAFDKVAKALNLGFPGGPIIQKRAEGYTGDLIGFPRPMYNQGYDFSFSGLKTAVVNYMNHHDLDENEITRITASFQETVIDVLVHKTIKAALENDLKHISLVGGVSANEPLRQSLTQKAQEAGCKVYLPHKKFSVDNGAMIAGLGFHAFNANQFADLNLNAVP